MRCHRFLPVCPIVLPLLVCAGACYPDSSKIRDQVARSSDTALPPPGDDVAAQADVVAGLVLDVGSSDGTAGVGDGLGIPTTDAVDVASERGAADAVDAPKPFDGPADGGTNADERCHAYAQAWCRSYQACAPGGFVRDYVTQEVCTTRLKRGCTVWASLPGATWPTAKCSTAIGTRSCTDFLDDLDPADCFAGGLIADGGDCSSEVQCQGRQCNFYVGRNCGKCAQRSAAGGSCSDDSDCQRGLVCQGKTCGAPGGAGAKCDDTLPCAGSLACGAAGKCVQQYLEGAACTPGYSECDWRVTSVTCSTTSNKCVKTVPSEVSCGHDDSNDTVLVCAGWRSCRSSLGACLPVPAIGEACDSTNGPKCMYPDICDSNTATCRLPAPDPTCGA